MGAFFVCVSRDPCAVYLYYNRGTNGTPKNQSGEAPIPPFTWIGILMYVYICLIYIVLAGKNMLNILNVMQKNFLKILNEFKYSRYKQTTCRRP